MRFPPDFTYPARKTRVAVQAARLIAGLIGQGVVFQAGGCAGLWPLALSAMVDHVYTCEPDPVNYACLVANLGASPAVTAWPCAVGATTGTVGLTRTKPQAGVWTVTPQGSIPLRTIDDLVGDQPIAAIVLDVEGSEVAAWQGARSVIARDRPLLWFEYRQQQDAIDAFLADHGYTTPTHILGADCISTPRQE